MRNEKSQISGLLAGWRHGDQDALDRLLPLIRTELHWLARRHLAREHKNHAMQLSSLAQEAFLRLLPGVDAGWNDRAHFFAAASQVMRHALVDHARERRRMKRGPDAAVDLDRQRLAVEDARKSRVFEMRLLGDMRVEETAEVLGVAPNTVIRDWSFAREWLRRELGGAGTTDCGTISAN